MTTFDEREKSFEKKFAHDQELQFKAQARRNKLLGLWAAEQMGLSGGDAESYAKDVVKADFEEPGEDDVLRKVRSDLAAKGSSVTEAQIKKKMGELMAVAKEQIMKETKA